MGAKVTEQLISGMVFDIQRMSIHDGPGIRTTVFLKGCPLRCLWCHNPEGRECAPELGFTPSLCTACRECVGRCPRGAHVLEGGGHRLLREVCARCFACAASCPAGALEILGSLMTASAVLDEAAKDRVFYEESGGGLTLSGGEPMVQFGFVRAVLEGAHAREIRTCIETSGAAPTPHFQAIAKLADLFLFDYKETDPERHLAHTGQSNENILRNLAALDALAAPTVLRCLIVPELNLRDDHIEGIATTALGLNHCRGVQILAYHPLGNAKCERIGVETPSGYRAPSPEEMQGIVDKLHQLGVENVTAE